MSDAESRQKQRKFWEDIKHGGPDPTMKEAKDENANREFFRGRDREKERETKLLEKSCGASLSMRSEWSLCSTSSTTLLLDHAFSLFSIYTTLFLSSSCLSYNHNHDIILSAAYIHIFSAKLGNHLPANKAQHYSSLSYHETHVMSIKVQHLHLLLSPKTPLHKRANLFTQK